MTRTLVRVNLDSLDAALDADAERVRYAARPAAQAGAQVLYEAVLRNVERLGTKTGNLRGAIYQAYSQANSSPGHATFQVSWNHRKAPHGHLVEYGFIQKYQVYLGRDGKWYTNKKAPLAQPRQVGAKAFVRQAAAQLPAAEAAIRLKFGELLAKPAD